MGKGLGTRRESVLPGNNRPNVVCAAAHDQDAEARIVDMLREHAAGEAVTAAPGTDRRLVAESVPARKRQRVGIEFPL